MEERGRKEGAKKNERILESCDGGAEKPARGKARKRLVEPRQQVGEGIWEETQQAAV